ARSWIEPDRRRKSRARESSREREPWPPTSRQYRNCSWRSKVPALRASVTRILQLVQVLSGSQLEKGRSLQALLSQDCRICTILLTTAGRSRILPFLPRAAPPIAQGLGQFQLPLRICIQKSALREREAKKSSPFTRTSYRFPPTFRPCRKTRVRLRG